MKYFWKINIYELQAILYWILGELILHLGSWYWLGWVSIGWGWITFVYVNWFAIKNAQKLEEEFDLHTK